MPPSINRKDKMLTPEAQLYFWSRHADNTPPERALEKWHRDPRNPRVKPEEIEAFLVDMVNRTESGDRGDRALYAIQEEEKPIPTAGRKAPKLKVVK